MIKELGLNRDTRDDTKNTHETCNHIQEDVVIAKHCKDLCNNFHLSVYENKRQSLINGFRNCSKTHEN